MRRETGVQQYGLLTRTYAGHEHDALGRSAFVEQTSLNHSVLVLSMIVLLKDGSQMANARTVTLADGKKVFAFSLGDAPAK